MLSKLASSECTCWSCVPMLWIDSLIDVGPATLPITFSKALFWALSRLSVLELNFSLDMSLSTRDWLSIYASEISSSFGWQIPTGFDDGGEGKESRNSIRASSMCIPLLRTLKRLSAEFILQLEKLELQKQWTWEPKMAESLILTLANHDDVVRKAGKIILEYLSSERLLTSGLQFLCSTASSLSAILAGLRFIFKQHSMAVLPCKACGLLFWASLISNWFMINFPFKETLPIEERADKFHVYVLLFLSLVVIWRNLPREERVEYITSWLQTASEWRDGDVWM
ncbi:uncharacterized protein LOC110038161 [Phalaenopsis equestris]|uniref:uncharacterized protein LOC110038161 n=1 Tax=Phalaenopsis equestris TaxID=78828 RepID=UPI0009E52B94|nr:uncharacterized protein LOC110038161 [Phalaenopsis equestris]